MSKKKVKPMDEESSGSGEGGAVTLQWPAFSGATGVILNVTFDGDPAGEHVIEDGGATEYGPIDNPDNAVIEGIVRPIGQPVDCTIKP